MIRSTNGLVAQAFKHSDTKIVTLTKTYDPNNEFDEEYFEFGLFMSRREYKTINRRLQAGRMQSVKEGKYCGSEAPLGYNKVKLKGDKGYTLVINKNEAEIIRTLFSMYAEGHNLVEIENHFELLGLKNKKGLPLKKSCFKDTLRNPVYIGKIRWNYKKETKKSQLGKIVKVRSRDYHNCLVFDGLHEPIIDIETWNKVQTRINEVSHSTTNDYTLKNATAGIIMCEKCGRNMQRRPYKHQPAYLICANNKCDNVSSEIDEVEKKLLESLKIYFDDLELKLKEKKNVNLDFERKSLININKEIEKTNKKISSLHDLLEEGIYSKEMFLERSNLLQEQLKELNKNYNNINDSILEKERFEKNKKEIIPQAKKVLKLYDKETDIEYKNALLKSILEKVTYLKTEKEKKGNNRKDNFTLKIYIKY